MVTTTRLGNDSVAERLAANFERLTRTERKAARCLQDHYPFLGLDTVSGFARRAAVSAPSVLRLLDKLGFAGYGEFQSTIRREIETRLKSPLQKKQSSDQLDNNFAVEYADQVCGNIARSMQHIPAAELERVADLLADLQRRVFFLGGRFSSALAQYGYAHLHALRGGIRQISGQAISWPEYLMDMQAEDLLMIFDVRRYQFDINQFARDAQQRGVRVILFTDQWLSPVARSATHIFSVRCQTLSKWDSFASILVVVETLVAIITRSHWQAVEKRLEELEKVQTQLQGS
ncbi:MAG TPA: MurR/RpiR family transcriptional regulator [Gammaproteobacteria bacterium]|nr:MurR/RpiR family transcriptional regulator [Gammaproteobacteria bacterium]